MFYSISKDLEGDTWKQKDVIKEQNGTIVEQKSTIMEQEDTIMVQNNTILEQKHEIESLETELEESRAMARMLLQCGRENTELTAFTESLYSEFPWMTQDDRLLVSLMCYGISPNAASVILDTDLNRLNKWKTRLAKQMGIPTRLSKYLKDRLSSYRTRPLRKESKTSAIA